MRKSKLVGTLLSAAFLCLGYYYYAKSSADMMKIATQKKTVFRLSLNTSNITATPKNDDSKISPSHYYCNFPKEQDAHLSEEGIGEPGWKLKQVQVIIRHGDRTPLSAKLYKRLKTVPDFCNIFSERVQERELVDFRQSVDKDLINYRKQKIKAFKLFAPPMPDAILCSPGQLTTMGAAQHLNIGLLLRKKYIEQHKLLGLQEQNKSIAVLSTHIRRTFQSAVAFLYGLIPDYHLEKVNVHTTASSTFCGLQCSCPRVSIYTDPIKNKRYSVYVQRQKSNAAIRRISDTLKLSDHTGTLIDDLITGYLCKQKPLPCSESGICVKESDLDILMNEQEQMNRIVSTSASLNQSLLEMQPMLKLIAGQMNNILHTTNTTRSFLLYSGHDTTIRPLLEALQLPEYRWPRLASRLVFELWESPQQQHSIKIIYNGKDVTQKTAFSKSANCPFAAFQRYVDTGMSKQLGFKSRETACKDTN